MKLTGKLLHIEALTKEDKNEMYALMCIYFDRLSHTTFLQDLHEKQWIIILRNKQSSIKGFSTIMIIDEKINGIDIKAIFSGDTIIDREYWGNWTLFSLFGKFIIHVMTHYTDKKIFWFLISMGYRTYYLLPLFFNTFYPAFDRPMPAFEKDVLNLLAYNKYSHNYNSVTGIIHSKNGGEFLKSEISTIPEHKLLNPHIHYFVEKNPHYMNGDELACIAPINSENLKSMVYRLSSNVKEDLIWNTWKF
jgi:hypothetical protein